MGVCLLLLYDYKVLMNLVTQVTLYFQKTILLFLGAKKV